MIQVIPKAVCNVGYGGVLSGGGTVSTQVTGVVDGIGSLTITPTSGTVGHPVSVAGTFRNLVVYSRDTTRPGDITVTLMKNGAETALTVTLPDSSTSVSVTAEIAVAVGDRVYYKFVGPATGAFGHDAALCIEFESTTHAIYGLMAFAGSVVDGNGKHGGAFGNGVFQDYGGSGLSNTYSICAVPGFVTRLDLYAHSGAPGAGVWTGYIVVDGVIQDGTGLTTDTACVLTGGAVAASSIFSLPTALASKYDVLVVRSGGDAAFSETHVSAGVAYLPAVDGEYQFCGGSNDTTSSSSLAWKWTRSEQVAGPETRHLAPVGPRGFTVSGMYIRRGGSPGDVGVGYVHIFRRNEADTTLAVTISDSETEDVFFSEVPCLPDGVIDIQIEPFGSPDPVASQLHWGLAVHALTPQAIDDAGVIGPLVWLHWPRLVHDAEDVIFAPPTAPVPPPPPPEAPPPGGGPVPPPEEEGEYGPQSTITCE